MDAGDNSYNVESSGVLVEVSAHDKLTLTKCKLDKHLFMAETENTVVKFVLHNTAKQSVTLKKIFVKCREAIFDDHLKQKIPANGKIEKQISLDTTRIGVYFVLADFEFASLIPISILNKSCSVNVELLKSNPTIDQLAPVSDYDKRGHEKEVVWSKDLPHTTGEKFPIRKHDLERTLRLGPQYDPPKDMKMVFMKKGYDLISTNHHLACTPHSTHVIVNRLRYILKQPIGPKNYIDKFTLLLHCERHQQDLNIAEYDIYGARFSYCTTNRGLLCLQVDGLEEGRPSVLRGDWIRVRADSNSSKYEHRGIVHDIRCNEILVSFDRRFRKLFNTHNRYNVRFTVTPTPFRIQQRAIHLSSSHPGLQLLLFPTSQSRAHYAAKSTFANLQLSEIRFFNRDIESNPEQQQAVLHILKGSSRPSPYLIFGPPGTGKTVTVVEAIAQVHKHACDPLHAQGSVAPVHILVCAHSNTAADLLAKRLLKHSAIDKRNILRLMAESRPWRAVPEEIRDICNFDNRIYKEYYYPSKKEIMKYDVIVCTLTTAGRLVSACFPPNHFTHLFIDEAGQATEPETLVPIVKLFTIDPNRKIGGQLVLAGDPKQLGPVLFSPRATSSDLSRSLLERLMITNPLYARAGNAGYNEELVTKLVQNYRSHSSILNVPNQLFYDSELKVFADVIVRQSLCNWEYLPKKDFPLIFYEANGKEKREADSPSYFNPVEVSVVLSYVEKLLASRNPRITQKDIGIITPYRKQVEKLRCVLRSKSYTDIPVGSVEEFQGQEYRIVIISTVRSDMPGNSRSNIGFLNNPKFQNAESRFELEKLDYLHSHDGRIHQFKDENPAYLELFIFVTDVTKTSITQFVKRHSH